MKTPTIYEEACTLAMWANGFNRSLTEVRAAGRRVATFMEQADITESQNHEFLR